MLISLDAIKSIFSRDQHICKFMVDNEKIENWKGMGSVCPYYTTPVIWKEPAGSQCCLSKLTFLVMALTEADICCNQCNSSSEVRSSKKRKHDHVSTPILADQLEKPLAEALKYSILCASLLRGLYNFFSEFMEILSTTSYFLVLIWNIQYILSPKLFIFLNHLLLYS